MGTKKLNKALKTTEPKKKVKQNSILKEERELSLKEWEHDIVVKCETTSDYISPEEVEKTTFSREK